MGAFIATLWRRYCKVTQLKQDSSALNKIEKQQLRIHSKNVQLLPKITYEAIIKRSSTTFYQFVKPKKRGTIRRSAGTGPKIMMPIVTAVKMCFNNVFY